MAITRNKNLEITELDFDEIKNNLKTFMSAQDQFTDYNFEGSGMNILLDVLAYNTHYLAYNTNMVANEMFLNSSILRSSIVSHAKTLGYVPQSARAANTTINIFFQTNVETITMPLGTVFETEIDGDKFLFSTISSFSGVTNGDGIIEIRDVPIYEGSITTTRYTVSSTNVDQRFVIPSNRVDTKTLVVEVQDAGTTNTKVYSLNEDISKIDSTSDIYFLQEVEDGKFEVYFGDGVLGSSLSDEQVVILRYIVTNQTLGNGGSVFTNAGAIAGVTTISTISNDVSSGGSGPETLKSIKLNAPQDYASQGRCVTNGDYEVYAKKLFPNTQTVAVWGGEDGTWNSSTGQSDTPEYGKVFISIKSTTGNALTETQKENLLKEFEKYTVASIVPVIADPETLFITLNTQVKFNSAITTKTYSDITAEVRKTIRDYNTNSLSKFTDIFRFSEVMGLIDDTDDSITSNSTTITLQKLVTPNSSQSVSYTANFSNAFLHPYTGYNSSAGGVVSSTAFYILGNTNKMYLDDDGSGNLRIYYLVAGVRTYISSASGSVDYTKGIVFINPIIISSLGDVTAKSLKISVIPNSNDIIPVRNQLLEIDTKSSIVSTVVDSSTTSNTTANISATSSSSTGGVVTGSSSGSY